MRKRRLSAVWLVVPSLWFACERDRPLGRGPDAAGDAGAANGQGDSGEASTLAGQPGTGADGGTSSDGGRTGGGGGRAGTAGTAGSSPNDPRAGNTSSGGATGGFSGTFSASGCGPVVSPKFDDSHCETPTFTMSGSTCSTADTRAELACGEPGSQFDSACCRRTHCAGDDECGDGGRCLPRIAQAPLPENVYGSYFESCEPSCSGCGCLITDDVDVRGYCVSAEEDLARFDCPVSGVTCEELSRWHDRLDNDHSSAEEFGSPHAAAEMRRCLDRIEAELRSECEGTCADQPNEPFDVSHCEDNRKPFLDAGSTCTTAATRAALACGQPGSPFGRDCCRRQACSDDESCGEGGRCIVRVLNVQGSAPREVALDECSPYCTWCGCSGPPTDAPDFGAYCIGPDENVARFDCPVQDLRCDVLGSWLAILPEYRDGLSERNEPVLSAQVQTCLDRVQSEFDEERCDDD